MIRARVRSGVANARAKGVRIGRPQATADDTEQNFQRVYPSYKNGTLNVSELARVCEPCLKQSINTFLFWSKK